jgi:hypothetical protein
VEEDQMGWEVDDEAVFEAQQGFQLHQAYNSLMQSCARNCDCKKDGVPRCHELLFVAALKDGMLSRIKFFKTSEVLWQQLRVYGELSGAYRTNAVSKRRCSWDYR